MEIFRFKNWNVYKDGKKLLSLILKIVNKLPQSYKHPIGDQLIRAGLSVVLNIAEGSGKDSDKELNRFFNISIGSINETLAIMDVLQDYDLINKAEFDEVSALCTAISKQIGGFKKKIKGQEFLKTVAGKKS